MIKRIQFFEKEKDKWKRGLAGLAKRKDVGSNRYGKIKMFLEFYLILLWLALLAVEQRFKVRVFEAGAYVILLSLAGINLFAYKSVKGYLKRYAE